MKIFIVTSLIEGQDEGAEVNVVGVKKTEKEAYELMKEVLEQAKEMYEENDIDYNVEEYDDKRTIVIETTSYDEEEDEEFYNELERIEYNIIENEVE